MKTDKLLTININHVSCETMRVLHIEPYVGDYPFIDVYPMGQYNKLIRINDKKWYKEYSSDEDSQMPKDLIDVLNFALDHKATFLMLAVDGEVSEGLYFFDD